MQLPHDLHTALDAELHEAPAKDLAAAVRDLSQRYRLHHGQPGATFLRSGLDAAAYAAYRLPATFAAIAAVLGEVWARRQDLQPETLLDVGGGPGTAAWAAVEVWPDLQRITILDRDVRMVRMGRSLAAYARSPAMRDATWREVDVTVPWDCDPADITIAAYLMGELPEAARAEFVQRLWDHTADTCIVVEPGTPRGFGLIRQAGDELAGAGAHIVAPFPQDWQCLDHDGDWCHFSQRVPRTRIHRTAKGAALSYEDEKFSYVAASRLAGLPIAARVIRHPQVRSGHIRLVLCTAEGVKHVVVTRSQRDAYRRAKDLSWGSAIPAEEGALFGLPS